MKAIELLLSDAHGIYIPKNFYNDFDLEKWNVSNFDLSSLDDPENEDYWDTWDFVLNKAFYVIGEKTYNLHQDGDLLAICYDDLTEDEKCSLGWED